MALNLNQLINSLPDDLLKDRHTFNSIINQNLLNLIAPDKLNSILNKHMPLNLSDEDKLNTVRDLFDNKLHFLNLNQMDNFYKQAKIHKFTPDLVKHLNELKLLKKKAYRLEEKKFQCKLLNEIIVKKRLLIQRVLQLPPTTRDDINQSMTNGYSSTVDRSEIIRKVNERLDKELQLIDLNDEQDTDSTTNKLNNLIQKDEETMKNVSINYSMNDEEYLKLLKNFKRKKLKNQIDLEKLKESSIKQVIDRVLENPSTNFETLLTEQSKNFKTKRRKLLIKKSAAHKSQTTNASPQISQQKPPSIEKVISSTTTITPISTPKPKNSKINNTIKVNHSSSKENLKYQLAPASFFSLIRNVFYNDSTNDLKLTLHKLEELVKERLRNFDPKLGWQCELVQSAMNYLSNAIMPPNKIPLVDYKEKNQQWQWIANEGHDTDEMLIKLTEEWMTELNKYSLLDPSQPVPPAISQTNWAVQESTPCEKEEYRKQEVIRYENPDRSFTFDLHNYRSIVGPVKNCTAKESATPKNKEKTALLKERPPFVTLLSLVRDSAARLPNGEGTRFDICSLLKDSQYLREDISDEQISAIVSGALDRLHYEKDPCVRYDVNQKKWVYLHRYRTEEDFDRLHQKQIEANLAKKNLQQKVASSKKSSFIKPSPIITTNVVSNNNGSMVKTVMNVTSKLDKKNEIDQKSAHQPLSTISSSPSINHVTNPIKIPNHNQARIQTKLIELGCEPKKLDIKTIENSEFQNIKITTYQSNRTMDESNKKELNKKKSVVNQTKRPNIVRIKRKIDERDKMTYATTFSNIKSDLINKSIKQKNQKQTNKKLKSDQLTAEITINSVNNATTNNKQTNNSKTNQIKITNVVTNSPNFTMPTTLISSKPTCKDDSKIMIQQNGNRINLSANVILSSPNGPLILSPSANNLNGYTSYTMSKNFDLKNGNQILFHPQNTTISKLISSPQTTSLSLQGIRLVPYNANSLQQSNLSKAHIAGTSSLPVSKIMSKPVHQSTQIIDISTSSSNQGR